MTVDKMIYNLVFRKNIGDFSVGICQVNNVVTVNVKLFGYVAVGRGLVGYDVAYFVFVFRLAEHELADEVNVVFFLFGKYVAGDE